MRPPATKPTAPASPGLNFSSAKHGSMAHPSWKIGTVAPTIVYLPPQPGTRHGARGKAQLRRARARAVTHSATVT